MSYKKSDLVIVNGYNGYKDQRGIIVKGDCMPGGAGVAKVLFKGEVVFIFHRHIKKIDKTQKMIYNND